MLEQVEGIWVNSFEPCPILEHSSERGEHVFFFKRIVLHIVYEDRAPVVGNLIVSFFLMLLSYRLLVFPFRRRKFGNLEPVTRVFVGLLWVNDVCIGTWFQEFEPNWVWQVGLQWFYEGRSLWAFKRQRKRWVAFIVNLINCDLGIKEQAD